LLMNDRIWKELAVVYFKLLSQNLSEQRTNKSKQPVTRQGLNRQRYNPAITPTNSVLSEMWKNDYS
jgi:hypothetical protein